jgi:hypothetical protein
LLHNGRHAATNLCDLDNGDGLARYYAFYRFKTCHTTLDLLGETLSQYDVVSEDETIKINGSHTIDKVGPYTHHRRCCYSFFTLQKKSRNKIQKYKRIHRKKAQKIA